MTKLFVLMVFALSLAGSVHAASAQDAPAAGGGGGGSATTYDFDDDLVQGDLVRPDGENLMVRRRGARESLIKIREHFVPELLKSVENL
jgi:opacity protein-like surface antigen